MGGNRENDSVESLRPTLKRVALFWRSPTDQPAWARPVLLIAAVVAGLAYGWGLSDDVVQPFYGAAARSMSQSWHDFIFGAFDPFGTVTIDKLPGELWVQALLLRVTGFHLWAIVLPQVIEGSLAILVLYRAVRRVWGPVAGIVAAICLAASPITVLLNRGNISDSLFILLSLLAADSTTKAFATGQQSSLLVAGLWLGLAFQTKMLEAWIVALPVAIAFVIATPRHRRRWRTAVGFGLVTVVVSLSWITAVSLVPAHDRPYVDASQNNSEFDQVFYYNGLDRFGLTKGLGKLGTPAPFIAKASDVSSLAIATEHIPAGWNRLLKGAFGADDGWLLPGAILALLAALLARRRQLLDSNQFGSVVLWGLWLVLFFAIFSAGSYDNSYYVATLSPPIAALIGIGYSLETDCRTSRKSGRVSLTAAVSLTAIYDIFLVPASAGVRSWLVPTIIAAGLLADIVLVLPLIRPSIGTCIARAGPVFVLAAVLLVPTVASASSVRDGLGPFDYPFDPPSVVLLTQYQPRNNLAAEAQAAPTIIKSQFPHADSVVGTETSVLGEAQILFTGREFLPVGGYLGGNPAPSLKSIQHLVADGQLRRFIAAEYPANPDPRFAWIRRHCTNPNPQTIDLDAPIITTYVCTPS
jgi:4-amino-4-deoxy-L-arabinose transferase-like glycosyltransferase